MGCSQGAIILWLISLLAFMDQIGSNRLTDCEVKKGFTSPYVEPLYQQTLIPTGCTSKSLARSGREVHVISVLNSPENTIKVKLMPMDKTDGVLDRQLVVVLHSIQPVTWQIMAENIINQTRRNVFLVSSRSRLENLTKINIKRRRTDQMPENDQLLYDWVEQKFHAVTSFSQVREANSIIKRVGIDPSLPADCHIVSNFQTTSIQLAMIHKQKLVQGCVVPSAVPLGRREVHIIEVHSSTVEQFGTHTDITVDISPLLPSKILTKNMVLVLVAHRSANVIWKINSRNLRGRIDVVGNDLMNTTGVASMAVTVRQDNIGRERVPLINWVKNQYGLPRSYTEVSLANRISIRLDEIAPPSTYNRTNRTSRRRSPFLNPDETRSALQKSVMVTCFKSGMQVTVAKAIVQVYGVIRNHISLADKACPASENQTHYILNTMLDGCNSRRKEIPAGVEFINSVVISKLPQDDSIPVEAGSASYQHDDASGDGMMSDDTRMDDEDLYESDDRISYQFSCEYLSSDKGLPKQSPPVLPSFPRHKITQQHDDNHGKREFGLRLYGDSKFRRLLYMYPLAVREGERIFIEADLTGDTRLRVNIHACWLSRTAGYHDNEEKHLLIDNGCRKDNTVQWHKDSSDDMSAVVLLQRQRFSFQLFKYFSTAFVFLHCDLMLCSRDGVYGRPSIQKCMQPNEYCVAQSQKTGSDSSQNKHSIFKGPLKIEASDAANVPILNNKNYNNDDMMAGLHPRPSNTKDKETVRPIIVQGLDSGTVIGIAFAAFIIGVLLTASLWYIHTHTGPGTKQHKRKMARRRGESSGESTPSSSVPMAV
ncbi:transforming growth factor beta receptor type 3-like [Lineus longissimus]|uniref:transforming growth factor beta receptor type 3-like n=1 Tax=Lineus longissimus TaxID=88925 RepID=UPI002B4EE2D9